MKNSNLRNGIKFYKEVEWDDFPKESSPINKTDLEDLESVLDEFNIKYGIKSFKEGLNIASFILNGQFKIFIEPSSITTKYRNSGRKDFPESAPYPISSLFFRKIDADYHKHASGWVVGFNILGFNYLYECYGLQGVRELFKNIE
jgi:hypothetical protein